MEENSPFEFCMGASPGVAFFVWFSWVKHELQRPRGIREPYLLGKRAFRLFIFTNIADVSSSN
jgi:hypothetical protein